MASYRLTNKAVDDLSWIWDFTFDEWSESQADKYYYMLLDSFEGIAKFPDSGKNYSGVVANLSGFKVGRHIIFYRRIDKHEVEIVRILHEQMDLKNRIKDK